MPNRFRLLAGTRLTRIHTAAFSVAEFNPNPASDPDKGGRFDATPDDPFGFLYAAEDDPTAVSEPLLRDLPIDEEGTRVVHNGQLEKLSISWINTTIDLNLVSLRSGRDLAATGQDTWLTSAPASDYAVTRRWAAEIRKWAPWAQGLTWRSNREPDGFAYVFFADRCPNECFVEAASNLPIPLGGQNLDAGPGRSYVETILKAYRVALV